MQINLFDLNLLRALDALLRERNVTRAAEQLHVTQQAMSGSLKRLREHFGDEILMRVGQHLEPTPLGLALVRPLRELMLQIALALEIKPEFDPVLTERRFTIAISDYAMLLISPHLMPYLARHAPGIVCDMRMIDDALYRDLETGDVDFCVLPRWSSLNQSARPAGIHSLPMFSDDFVCVVGKDNPSVGSSLDLPTYLAQRHTLVRLGSGVSSLVEQAWSAYGIEPMIGATSSSFASLIFMIPGSGLMATVPRKLALRCARMLPIRLLECPFMVDPLQEDLSWHERYESDPARAFVREAFRAAAAGVAGDVDVEPSGPPAALVEAR